MSWTTNPIMEWFDPRPNSATYNQWVRISDHGRTPLSVSIERIETKQRMANGRLRKHVVAKKRTFSCSWQNLPDRQTEFLANGQSGEWMRQFHDEVDGEFKVRFRTGGDVNKPTTDAEIKEATVMISDFSRDVLKRGPAFDLWSLDISLEEV